jgi:hypothetical protein
MNRVASANSIASATAKSVENAAVATDRVRLIAGTPRRTTANRRRNGVPTMRRKVVRSPSRDE